MTTSAVDGRRRAVTKGRDSTSAVHGRGRSTHAADQRSISVDRIIAAAASKVRRLRACPLALCPRVCVCDPFSCEHSTRARIRIETTTCALRERRSRSQLDIINLFGTFYTTIRVDACGFICDSINTTKFANFRRFSPPVCLKVIAV